MKKFPFILAIACLIMISFSACSERKSEITSEEIPEESSSEPIIASWNEGPEEVFYSIYNGLEIEEDQVGLRPMMVMIDNQYYARNQANLTKASIVWEMRVEGEFTRYMALFEQKPGQNDFLVGPIRSARPNFVTIANQYGAIYAHHGGSADGLRLIDRLGLDDLEAMREGGNLFFRYRKTGKRPPHDSYFNLEDAFKQAEKKGYEQEGKNVGFSFHPIFEPLDHGESAQSFLLDYQGKLNNIEFKYLPEKQAYERYREGTLQVDEGTEEPVLSTNVIIQYANSYIYDNKGHKAFDSIGEGKGFYVTGGKVIPIRWEKSDDHINPTRFLTEDGEELVLNPGLTWICVIDDRMDPNFE
ncbi:DUF3048 domain-containing protein [Kallipyga gabonensis]|uniref:DUF3048 domain-containing protein n=1 Tax=Kallipyga gabonensis TaxID=1686287 RepID=UPI0006B4CB0B|nr:DUF3048 domain-containing protein [Kallipyga gabonensis]